MRKIKNIVVHCTATSAGASLGSILRYWREVMKWNTPGYHLIVMLDGRYARLQPDELPTNGVKGHNKDSIHISYVGGIDHQGNPLDTRTPQQKKTLETLVRTMRERYPKAKILGHRDFEGVTKACPSFDVAQWIKEAGI